jgi:hypothetical protein
MREHGVNDKLADVIFLELQAYLEGVLRMLRAELHQAGFFES